ncbi:hypothetical protein [Paenibacillus shenyangensis]|uniref:hypothetical protein n=1 Tax=Paenibacillus sp. A9 TaxID=1284352 RepID=UPI00036F1356|nr:hypothetical protein [Paenibacillus sp. A9]
MALTLVVSGIAYHYQQQSSDLQEKIDREFTSQIGYLQHQLERSHADSITENLYMLQNHASKANAFSRLTSYYINQPQINALTGLLESFFANYTAEKRSMTDTQMQQFIAGLDQVGREPDNFEAIEKVKLLLVNIDSK